MAGESIGIPSLCRMGLLARVVSNSGRELRSCKMAANCAQSALSVAILGWSSRWNLLQLPEQAKWCWGQTAGETGLGGGETGKGGGSESNGTCHTPVV